MVLLGALIQDGGDKRGVYAADEEVIDAVLAGMSPGDKVGQLFMVSFSGSAAAAIEQMHVGSVVLLASATSAAGVSRLTSELQHEASHAGLPPLLISVNHEGGDIQPIRTNVSDLGPNWQLGLMEPDSALHAACERGAIHGAELQAMGISMNLAPVLDVWDNPLNTVIGQRSYSADPAVVARLGAGYIEGLQAAGVLAIGKHFPGHGSSVGDSHLELPGVLHDRAWLDTHELVPFRAAIQANVAGVMTAHVSYPLVDSQPDRPASLSPTLVSGLLRQDMGFDGLVVTDDLGAMQAITAHYSPGEAAIEAIEAGSDLLIVVGSVEHQEQMIDAVLGEVGGRISPERLDDAVRHVLQAKQQAGLLGPDRPTLAPAHPLCASAQLLDVGVLHPPHAAAEDEVPGALPGLGDRSTTRVDID